MNPTPLKGALSDLERDVERARDARYQIECDLVHRYNESGGWEDPAAALLPETRRQLLDRWAYFEKNGGIGKTQARLPQGWPPAADMLQWVTWRSISALFIWSTF